MKKSVFVLFLFFLVGMISINAQTTETINLNEGWNLVSVPVTTEDMSLGAIFPDAISVWGFSSNAFTAPTNLEVGKGYWVNVPNAVSYTVTGTEEDVLVNINQTIGNGWNLIGAGVDSISAEHLPEHVSLFDWSGGAYNAANSVNPGKGYWMNVGEGGTLPDLPECSDNGEVCGVDGSTYNSECEINDAGVEIDHVGACEVIELKACEDGTDNDSDGLTDYPNDPGCDNLTDNDETDEVIPGNENLTQCSDGIDNDGDGLVDFSNDPGCDRLSDDDEANEAVSQSDVTKTITVSQGWNLVSVPVTAEDMSPSAIFPDAISIYGFSGTYFIPTTLEVGRGYWLNVPSAGSYTVTGVEEDTVTKIDQVVSPGVWNMIGAGPNPIQVNNLPEHVSLFEFSGGMYKQVSGTIRSGKGYWLSTIDGIVPQPPGSDPDPDPEVEIVPPTNLIATVSSEGNVILNWNPGDVNLITGNAMVDNLVTGNVGLIDSILEFFKSLFGLETKGGLTTQNDLLYDIWRKESEGSYSLIDSGLSCNIGPCSYVDTTTEPATYTYKVGVREINTLPMDAVVFSDEISVTVPSSANPQTGSNMLSLNEGWNLVSVPVTSEDMSPSVIFPDAISVWELSSSRQYVAPSVLEVGKGYWVNVPNAVSYTVTGTEEDIITKINESIIPEGWSIIGVGPEPIQVNNLPEHVSLFEFSGGMYKQVKDVTQSGMGYWINTGVESKTPEPPGGLSETVTRPIAVREGWNLVSVPVTAADMSPSNIFPGAISIWELSSSGQFVQPTTLQVGKGYWLNSERVRAYSVTGTKENITSKITEGLTSEGWNLIGAGADSISTEHLPEHVSLFDWSGGVYNKVNDIRPGKGYWMNRGGQGNIPELPLNSTCIDFGGDGCTNKVSRGETEVSSGNMACELNGQNYCVDCEAGFGWRDGPNKCVRDPVQQRVSFTIGGSGGAGKSLNISNSLIRLSFSTNETISTEIFGSYLSENPAPVVARGKAGVNFIELTSSEVLDGRLDQVDIGVSYDDQDVLDAGLDEDSLSLFLFNNATQEWEILESVVDTESNIVSGITTHFSLYGIFGDTIVTGGDDDDGGNDSPSGGGSPSSGGSSSSRGCNTYLVQNSVSGDCKRICTYTLTHWQGNGYKRVDECEDVTPTPPTDNDIPSFNDYQNSGLTNTTFDADSDGMIDDLEIQFFGNLSQNYDDDFDGDGISNGKELEDGTNPADSSDYLGVGTSTRLIIVWVLVGLIIVGVVVSTWLWFGKGKKKSSFEEIQKKEVERLRDSQKKE